MTRSANLIVISLSVLFLCLLSIGFILHSTARTEMPHYIVGDRRLPITSTPREHDVYFWLKEKGFRGATLLHISRYHDFLTVPKEDELKLYSRYKYIRLDLIAEYEKRLEEHNWVWVAVQSNIARKVITVLPYSRWNEIKDSLAQVRTGRIQGDWYRVADRGTPRITTIIDNLEVDEPVLLNVDASYFIDEEPEKLFRMLKDRGVKCIGAALSYVEGIPEEATETARARMRKFENMLKGMTS